MAALPCQAQAKPGRRTLTRRILPGTIYCVPLVYLLEREKKKEEQIFFIEKKKGKKRKKKNHFGIVFWLETLSNQRDLHWNNNIENFLQYIHVTRLKRCH